MADTVCRSDPFTSAVCHYSFGFSAWSVLAVQSDNKNTRVLPCTFVKRSATYLLLACSHYSFGSSECAREPGGNYPHVTIFCTLRASCHSAVKRTIVCQNDLYTRQMSVLMVFCGPHFPLAFQFVCCPGASGRFPFVWLRRSRRPRNTVELVVFVGGPLLETFVPLGILASRRFL